MRSTTSSDPLLGSRLHIAVKAAVAAAVAWQLGNLMPSPLGDYAYYAPLGAVLVVHPNVAGSLRDAGQLFGALLLGAALGAAFHALPLPGSIGVGLLVGVAVVAAGWDLLGGQRGWVISAALFTYILGNLDTSAFVSGLVGQVSLGAVIGFAVTFVLPPVPIRVAQRHLEAVADQAADQLDDIAAALLATDGSVAWQNVTRELLPEALRLRESHDALDDALRGNVRAGRWRDVVARRRAIADVVERVAALSENLAYTLGEVQTSEGRWLRPGGEAASVVAETLRDLAVVVRRFARQEEVRAAEAEVLAAGVERLAQVVAASVDRGEEAYPGAAVLVSLRRILGAVPVEEGATDLGGIPPLASPAWPPRRRRRPPR